MAIRQLDPVAEIQSAFTVLTKNWMLAIPTAISSVIATIYAFMVLGAALAAMGLGALGGRSGMLGALGAFTGVTGVGAIVVILVSLIATAMVMASAEDAWSGRPVDFSKSLGRAFACLLNIIIAGVIICVVFVVATILPFIGWVIVGYLAMYTLPAIVVGNANGVAAIGESLRLTTSQFGTSIVAFIGIVLAIVVGGILQNLFIHIVGLNFIIGAVVGGFTSAFAALVSVRFYDMLRAMPARIPAPPPAPPPTPTA